MTTNSTNINQSYKLFKSITITAIVAAALMFIYIFFNLFTNIKRVDNIENDKLSYQQVEPYIKYYLQNNGLLTTDGKVMVPNTSGSVTESTIENFVEKLLQEGRIDYIKGQDGAMGATGATGAAGAQGIKGDKGDQGNAGALNVGSGLSLSGGTLTLKPCAVDQVLAVDSSLDWTCATVTASGVDINTTNTSAALSLTGSNLTVAITDSDGNTVTSSNLDLGATFATQAGLTSAITALNISQYATTASVTALTSRVDNLETDLDDTNNDVAGLDTRVTTLENAGYVTDTELNTAINGMATQSWVGTQGYVTSTDVSDILNAGDYVTDSSLSGTLSSYLLSSEFHSTLAAKLEAGPGVTITDANNKLTISVDQSDLFVVIGDHLTDFSALNMPNPNQIYLEPNGSGGFDEYIYTGNSASDPTQAANWNKVGAITVDLSNYYTQSETDTAISQAINTNLSDLATNSNINSILGGYATTTNMTNAINTAVAGLATQAWVGTQGYVTSSSLTSTLAGYTTTTALSTALSGKQGTLNCTATQAFIGTGTAGTTACRSITDITSGTLASNTNLVTANTLNTILANYVQSTSVRNLEVVTTLPGSPDDNTVYYVTGP